MERKRILKQGVMLAAAAALAGSGLFLMERAPLSPRAAEVTHEWTHEASNDVQELNANTTELTAGMKYYLTGDVTASSYFDISDGTVEICLDGHTLTLSDFGITVNQGATLILHDCQTNGQEGKISGATSSAISVSGGTFTMNGGSITENHAGDYVYGAAVYVSGGTFTMNGGSITGNSATVTGDMPIEGGAGIYAKGGTVEIKGGTISGNTASGGYGGGILLRVSEPEYDDQQNRVEPEALHFTMTGGVIADNEAKYGGGIAVIGKVEAAVSGGVIGGKVFSDDTVLNGNRASQGSGQGDAEGGGVFLQGASIDLSDDGSDLVTVSPAFTMSGGTIGYAADEGVEAAKIANQQSLGNSATLGGGVFVGENATFTLEGDGVIGYPVTTEQYNGWQQDGTDRYPVGNTATKDYNAGGGGICVSGDNAKLRMMGGTVSYNVDSGSTFTAAGVFVTNGSYPVPEVPSSFEFSGGTISCHSGSGIGCNGNGKVVVSGGASITNCLYGIYASDNNFVEMSGGSLSENNLALVTSGSMLGLPTVTLTGGTISGNGSGVSSGHSNGFVGELSIGGTVVIEDNANENGEPENLVVGGTSFTLLEGFAGNVHLTVVGTPSSGFLTSGYQAGMEAYVDYDGTDGAVKPFTTSQDGQEITELALTYTLSLQIDGVPTDVLAGSYPAGYPLSLILYTMDEAGQNVLKEELAAVLKKDPTATVHYNFLEWQDAEGNRKDPQTASIDGDLVLNAVFEEEAHSFPDDWTMKDETSHVRDCTSCGYTETADHSWGAWSYKDDTVHARTCTEQGCTAEQTSAHDWGAWVTDGPDSHTHSCQEDGCDASESKPHTFPETWTSKDGEVHYRVCTDGCGETEEEPHTWDETWENEGDVHARTCLDGCGARETEPHGFSDWTDDQNGMHTRSCETGCDATETEAHSYPSTWAYVDETSHAHACLEECGNIVTEPHHWSAWTDAGDGLHHYRVCTDGCGARETALHDWTPWTTEGAETHGHSCQTEGCAAHESKPHAFPSTWSYRDAETHTHVCADGCGETEEEEHAWSNWEDQGDGTHARTCTAQGCTARESAAHVWSAWVTDGPDSHSHSCQEDGCTATESKPHAFPETWSYRDGDTHVRVCPDGCGEILEEEHHWTQWQNDGDFHSRTCSDGCGAEQRAAHEWGAWTDVDENTHSHVCTAEGCGATETSQHRFPDAWEYADETSHARTCLDGCGRTVTADHAFSAWQDDGEGNHFRVCEEEGCSARESASHEWGAWTPDEDGLHHYHVCGVEGCTARESALHTLPETWSYLNAEKHARSCLDGCGFREEADHSWGAWEDRGNGTHKHTCTERGCTAAASAAHDWGDWYATEGETRTHDCNSCTATATEADDGTDVVAALLKGDAFVPYYSLLTAFDEVEEGGTVYLVVREGGTAIGDTLSVGKSVLLENVTRSVGEDLRARYVSSDAPVRLCRADGFEGTLVRIERGVSLRLASIVIDGGESTAPAVEVYGSLTVAGGEIDALCAVRVLASETSGIALFSLGDEAALMVTGDAKLGAIRLDDPAGTSVPRVDFEGFTGTATVEISDTRPYGAFATNAPVGVDVVGGARWADGLSAREVRLQDGAFVCGGYDLTLEQTAFGEVTFGGVCDELLTDLTLTVNGQSLALDMQGGVVSPKIVETGGENAVSVGIGEASASVGLVGFNAQTGRLTAPASSTYLKGGAAYPLDGSDPLDLALVGDDGTVTVDGGTRTLDFSEPVGTSFVYTYLTSDGVPYEGLDFNNFARVQEAMELYGRLTERQRGVVDVKLSDTPFVSFDGIQTAMQTYLEEQSKKAEEFIEQSGLAKDFEELGAGDTDLLTDALQNYENGSEEDRHFLDTQAQDRGYPDFADMVDDMIVKTEFEESREETLGQLVLRGCDGTKVQEELSLVIETVQRASYDGCTDRDLRLEVLAESMSSLENALETLENIRTEERQRAALSDYLTEKQQSGRYTAEQLSALSSILSDAAARFDDVDPSDADGARQLEEIYEECLALLNDTRASTVSTGDLNPSSLPEYDEETEELIGYLTSEDGFRGDSSLSILLRPAEETDESDLVGLFDAEVLLTGDTFTGETTVVLLLPENARGYTGYRVRIRMQDGSLRTVDANVEGDALTFALDTDELSAASRLASGIFDGMTFSVLAQREIDLSWLVALLSCLCILETAAICYVATYLKRKAAAAVMPAMLAVLFVPASAIAICSVLGGICLAEAAALAVLLAVVLRRDRKLANL